MATTQTKFQNRQQAGSAGSFNQIAKYDPESEECLLACLFLKKDLLLDCDFLIEDMFYGVNNKSIFKAILAISNENGYIDQITVSNYVRSKLNIENGLCYEISEIAMKVLQPYNFLLYAYKIKEDWMRREMINLSFDVRNKAQQDSEDISDIISEANQKIENISLLTVDDKTICEPINIIDEILTEYEERHSSFLKGDIIGCTSGLEGLDKNLCGFKNGKLYIIAGRPGSGKTEIALKIARETATKRLNVLFFSLEMPKNELVERLIFSLTEIDTKAFKQGNLTDEGISELINSKSKFYNLPIIISDRPDQSIDQVRSAAKRYKKLGKCDMVIIDYLQLMGSSSKYQSREAEVSFISRSLKKIAKELEVPVIALSQLNRECEKRVNKRPQLSDLRESGAIEQDADCILFIYRPEYYYEVGTEEVLSANERILVEKGKGEIDIAKHRGGGTGTTFFYYNENFNKLFGGEYERDDYYKNKSLSRTVDYTQPITNNNNFLNEVPF